MKQPILIYDGDTLLDAATRCGNPTALFDLATANGLNITDDIVTGTEIEGVEAERPDQKIKFSSFKKTIEEVLLVENLLDAATAYLNPEQLFEWANLNGLQITDEFAPGTALKLPEIKQVERRPLLFVEFEKKKPIVVYYGQTPLDICIQELGDPETLFKIAALNGIDPTADLLPGSEIKVIAAERTKQRIADVFAMNNLRPASSTDAEDILKPEGIDFWAIEDDFEVQE
jgi:hypothetical protein